MHSPQNLLIQSGDGNAIDQASVQVNYQFYHSSLSQTDPALIRIPRHLFEGPAQDCQTLFLIDLQEEYGSLNINPRQLEFWKPKQTLTLEDVVDDTWSDSVDLKKDFIKVLQPLSLLDQISVENRNLVHLVVTIKGGPRPVFQGKNLSRNSSSKKVKPDITPTEAVWAVVFTVVTSICAAWIVSISPSKNEKLTPDKLKVAKSKKETNYD